MACSAVDAMRSPSLRIPSLIPLVGSVDPGGRTAGQHPRRPGGQRRIEMYSARRGGFLIATRYGPRPVAATPVAADQTLGQISAAGSAGSSSDCRRSIDGEPTFPLRSTDVHCPILKSWQSNRTGAGSAATSSGSRTPSASRSFGSSYASDAAHHANTARSRGTGLICS